jgi:aminomethyltransferase
MPIATPFYSKLSEHVPNHQWREWGGKWSVTQFGVSHEHEYYSIRNSAGLLDASPLFKYEVTGKDAEKLINRVITRDIRKCKVGQIFYTPWCDDDGKVVDDGTVWRLSDTHFRVTCAEPNKLWLEDAGFMMDATVTDVSDSIAAMALQGPNARAILSQLVDPEAMASLKYFFLFETQIDGFDITISRTGYTGDLGYEIWLDAKNAEAFWDRIMAVGQDYGMALIGINALDQARIEAGLIMLDVDYYSSRHAVIEKQKSSPYEITLGWAVDLKKDNFIGKAALAKEKRTETGTSEKMVGIEIDWIGLEESYEKVGLPPQVSSVPCREGTPVYKGATHVGKITSKCYSPLLKKYIALAAIEKQHASEGTEVEVEITVDYVRRKTRGIVRKLPFFASPLKRSV